MEIPLGITWRGKRMVDELDGLSEMKYACQFWREILLQREVLQEDEQAVHGAGESNQGGGGAAAAVTEERRARVEEREKYFLDKIRQVGVDFSGVRACGGGSSSGQEQGEGEGEEEEPQGVVTMQTVKVLEQALDDFRDLLFSGL